MLRKLAAIALYLVPLVAWGQSVVAIDLPAADHEAIEKVIVLQLIALQHDEAELAFSYVSPMLQYQVGTSERFLDMVTSDYPAVHRARDVDFLKLEATWDGPVQSVFFFGPDGEPVIGRYFMQKQEDGSWKINGCQLVAAPGQGI